MNQFKKVYDRWKQKKLTQKEAAEQPGITERTLRRYIVRYRGEGTEGLLDRRLGKVSPRRAPQQETSEMVALYRDLYPQRNVAHFHEAYTERHGGKRSYSWVKRSLYRAGWKKTQGRWTSPPAQGTQGTGGNDDTSGREHARVGFGEEVGPCGHDG